MANEHKDPKGVINRLAKVAQHAIIDNITPENAEESAKAIADIERIRDEETR